MENSDKKTICPLVYQAINNVQKDLSVAGISKDKNNVMQKYKFRGIDDVFNALSPLLSKHSLCILPKVKTREVVERKTAKGGALFYVTLEVDFNFVSSVDGSCHVVTVFGEAMDSSDKATNKAMSAAYKYACIQSFSIPTESADDADSQTHEPVSSSKSSKKVVKQKIVSRSLDECKAMIEKSKSVDELKNNWVVVWRSGLVKDDLDKVEVIKNDRKAEIEDLARSFSEETGVKVNA